VADLRGRHWFLPDTPDITGLLRSQVRVTIEGIEAFAGWAAGDAEAAEILREAEHRADDAKREVLKALRAAFVTPLEPEDVFALSRGTDWILNHARDLVNEAEVMGTSPDSGIAEMAGLLLEAVRNVDDAIAHIGSNEDEAIAAADAALSAERRLERAYYRGMAALLEVEEMRVRIGRRELYRRCSRIGETVVDVAERVVYAVVKES
jgi:uncharacterized protein